MNDNNNGGSGVNTVLIVIILLVLVGALVWFFSQSAPSEQVGAGVEINLPTEGGQE